jgi:hypothetical protein
MIVYAIQNIITERLPGINIITGGFDVYDSQTGIYLRDLGGETRGFPDNRSDARIQVLSRARSDFEAMQNCNKVFAVLREEFSIQAAFESFNLKINKIGAIQRPSSMGTSENGLYEYVFNYEVIFSEKYELTEFST